MEFCEDGLETRIKSNDHNKSEKEAWIAQLALGLQHIHKLGVMHRDICPVC